VCARLGQLSWKLAARIPCLCVPCLVYDKFVWAHMQAIFVFPRGRELGKGRWEREQGGRRRDGGATAEAEIEGKRLDEASRRGTERTN